MSESFLQILLYLFGHYITDEILQPSDPDALLLELAHAGFSVQDSNEVIEWLAGTKNNAAILAQKKAESLRIYTANEIAKIDVAARGFLMFLEQAGVLDGVNRERLIDRAMALQCRHVDLPELRYLCQVLLNNDGPTTHDGKQTCDLLLAEGTKH